jgi:hypothetical protein
LTYHLDATGSPSIPNYGHSLIYGVKNDVIAWELQDSIYNVASKLAKNLRGNRVPVKTATLRGIHRFAPDQLL